MEYLFTIFHRLNAGGIKLNNQEIRNCIYGGPLNELLHIMDEYVPWRKINRMKEGKKYRFVKQEIILRFFAFLERPDRYTGQIAKFLNDYMAENRNIDVDDIEAKTEIFQRTIDFLSKKVFPEGPDGRIPTSVLESALVAIAKNIDFLDGIRADQARSRYRKLREHEQFKEEAVAEGLSKVDKVTRRFAVADELFSPTA